MAETTETSGRPIGHRHRAGLFPLHPLHAILLAFPVAMFTGGLLSDLTYLQTAEVQWTNFSAWLITGALLFGGLALAWALIGWLVDGRPAGRSVAYIVLLVVGWVFGLVNAFQHSRDGWSSVGTAGLILSLISTIAVLAAAWVAHKEAAR